MVPNRNRAVMSIAVVGLSILALAGCRPEERNRKLSFTPGVYSGEAMPKISPEQVKALQERGLLLK